MATHTVTGVHPVADLFPMLDDDEMASLAADIKANGLRQPIVLDPDGLLIDGRNRLAACERAGVEPTFTTLNGGQDPVAFIMSSNTMRRQMTKSQQAVVVALATKPPMTSGATRISEEARSAWVRSVADMMMYANLQPFLYQACDVVYWGEHDLAPAVVSGKTQFVDAFREADSRRRQSQDKATRIEEIRREAEDLALLVKEETLSLAAAYKELEERRAAYEERRRNDTSAMDRHVGYFADLRKYDDADLPGRVYDPSRSVSKTTTKDIDAAIDVLKRIKKGWMADVQR